MDLVEFCVDEPIRWGGRAAATAAVRHRHAPGRSLLISIAAGRRPSMLRTVPQALRACKRIFENRDNDS